MAATAAGAATAAETAAEALTASSSSSFRPYADPVLFSEVLMANNGVDGRRLTSQKAPCKTCEQNLPKPRENYEKPGRRLNAVGCDHPSTSAWIEDVIGTALASKVMLKFIATLPYY